MWILTLPLTLSAADFRTTTGIQRFTGHEICLIRCHFTLIGRQPARHTWSAHGGHGMELGTRPRSPAVDCRYRGGCQGRHRYRDCLRVAAWQSSPVGKPARSIRGSRASCCRRAISSTALASCLSWLRRTSKIANRCWRRFSTSPARKSSSAFKPARSTRPP